MRVTYRDLMDRLGAGYELRADDTLPMALYDPDDRVTYMAEIRVGYEKQDVDGEIQVIHDVDGGMDNPMEHICALRCRPESAGQWEMVSFTYRGKPPAPDTVDWQGKGCDFFRSLLAELAAGRVPKVDDLYNAAFNDRDAGGGGRGSGAGKAPKIKPGAMLNPKGGRGF